MKTDAVTELLQDVAARVILPRWRSLAADEIMQKRPGDLVTVADREAEIEIGAVLQREHPDALIVGEEACFGDPGLVKAIPDAAQAWVIDPVDGTKNFAAGRPTFGVMLAETRHGETVRSWIWQPISHDLYVAEVGAGVLHNGSPMAPPEPIERTPVAVLPRRFFEWFEAGYSCSRGNSSCAIDYPKLCTGEIDLLGYASINPWDHLPGSLMVSELGGFSGIVGVGRYTAATTGRALLSTMRRPGWDAAAARLR